MPNPPKRSHVPLAEWAASLERPISAPRARALVSEGRIKGAYKAGGNWMVPRNASVEGAGVRLPYGKYKGISVAEYARRIGVSRARVYLRLKRGEIAGAKKTKRGWDIPEDAPWPAPPGQGRGQG